MLIRFRTNRLELDSKDYDEEGEGRPRLPDMYAYDTRDFSRIRLYCFFDVATELRPLGYHNF